MSRTIKRCFHCGEDTKDALSDFCCLGCDAAYKIIGKFGLENYYKLRQINENERKIKPEIAEISDISEFITHEKDGSFSIALMVQGLHCAACVWLIESILKKQQNVISARINLSRKTLFLKWRGDAQYGNNLIHLIYEIGYKLLPFDEEILSAAEKKYDDSILRALAVAGFGAGNIMLFSVSLWFAGALDMGNSTRNFLHFFSSLIALPVVIFSARPFFVSAFRSLKSGYPNMDFAISMAIFLSCASSLFATFRGAFHVYFDSAVMLVFFLLIGRYLDLKARKKAFSVATEFTLLAASFGRIEENNRIKILPGKQLQEGMILLVAAGEKIAADGIVISGTSEIDTSLISGETLPKKITCGAEVFAGEINLASPLKIRITKNAQNSLLAQIIAIASESESKKNHYIRIADRLAKFYTPAVHLLAAITFILWFKSGWETALMNATAVLIITCPCALALAVPIVQTIVISNLMRRGILVKHGEALEKLREIDVIIFDKTGSITIGSPRLVSCFVLRASCFVDCRTEPGFEFGSFFKLAASLAKKSRHPLSQAICFAYDSELEELEVKEIPGMGLEAIFEDKILRLGRAEFCGVEGEISEMNCCLRFGDEKVIFYFEDEIKSDARETILSLKKLGKKIILLSGDKEKVVSEVAEKLDIDEFYSSQTPLSKVQFLTKLKDQNRKFVMVGDGLNDAPSLALADVSISFSKASDLAQNIADIVIQQEKLMPLIHLFVSSKKAILLMKQNLIIALIYNLIAIPFAIFGHITPLIAAFAMSSSSLAVLANSLRISNRKQGC
ncbi:MAG: hypothetical protein A2887_02885 [Alphaproteobacteria bacterium RIFCSPLOWO2_01_FULL_40_26]|nr:MAG: hypothetical protein A3D15_02650 [Alphaproteobacteria bacterium RIFCSPHIGHO2_02_FULL_40_34]OFW95118.1 MAG: hypothetical protein A2887_02885 [Alphaproteobacteria bacterium RIFCSPLOWO2_01_FULL_40_26]OFX09103.1 MAG: hypothetical protein A3H30_03465 [Alphaproteobacteria bacterium RIFCSPLOWO2_02_FULL_40_19]